MYDPSKPYKSRIQDLIVSTWNSPYVKVQRSIYPVLKTKFSGFEVDHTDGIGTKGFYHWQAKSFKAAVVDALAMNLNDLALMLARPYKIQNHLMLPKDDHQAVEQIIKHLVKECSARKIAMTGGETSIHDNSDSLDISISMTGIVERPKINKPRPGNILVGLSSNGLHSNGFSVVRKVFKHEFRPEFIRPTALYIDQIFDLSKKVEIKGMMHITGGAFTKLKDILTDTDAIIDEPLKPQLIFKELYAKGISDQEMYKTFNCGIGFVVAVSSKDLETCIKITGGRAIGRIVKGGGKVKVASAFSNNIVEY